MTQHVRAGLRLAVSMFTALPVPRRWHDHDLAAARAAVPWLPFVGAALGAGSGLVASAVLARSDSAELLAAALALGLLGLATRGLHLDGLADTADGLGSRAPAERALEIMRQSDIGPFGVVAIVVVLLVDVAALATAVGGDTWRAPAALAVAAATGRIAVVYATLPGSHAARPDGFGALVAGRGSLAAAVPLTAGVLLASAGLATATDADVLGWTVAPAAALALSALLARHAARRLGGVTGDVFGALIEITTAATLVGLALA